MPNPLPWKGRACGTLKETFGCHSYTDTGDHF